MDKNIYITGFMGAGKTTAARDLAKYLVWKFVDLDQEVEALSHRSIQEVTEKDGLEAVRKFEGRVLQKITEESNQVIALGAGTLLSPENLMLVRSSGVLIYFSAEISTLLKRLVSDTSKIRPLLGQYVSAVQNEIPNAEEMLQRQVSTLLKERLPSYVKADLKTDTDEKSIREITIETEKRLRSREQRVEFFESPKTPR